MGDKTYLLTVEEYDLQDMDIVMVDTFKAIDWDDIGCLIFHSSIESPLDVARVLSSLHGKVDKVIYINQVINPLYYCLFTGLNADIYETEEYLTDSSVLSYLLDSYKETGMTVKSPNEDLDTLAKAIATISSSDFDSVQRLVSNEFWLKTLSTAVENVDTAVARASKSNIEFLDILSESSNFIEMLQSGQSTTSKELEELRQVFIQKEKEFEETAEKARLFEQQKKIIDDMDKKYRPNSPFIFSTYSVPVTVPRVLYIKATGYCRYLNSFIGAYQHYLKMSKQLSSKILLVQPKLPGLIKRYQDVSRLAPDSVEIMDLGVSSAYVTYEPKKVVMDAFFNQPQSQVFIVIDMLFGDKLIDGHMVETLYAVGGTTDIKRFGIRPDKAIMSMISYPDSIRIPHIQKYHNANEHTKRTLYYEGSGDAFARLDKLVIQDGR